MRVEALKRLVDGAAFVRVHTGADRSGFGFTGDLVGFGRLRRFISLVAGCNVTFDAEAPATGFGSVDLSLHVATHALHVLRTGAFCGQFFFLLASALECGLDDRALFTASGSSVATGADVPVSAAVPPADA